MLSSAPPATTGTKSSEAKRTRPGSGAPAQAAPGHRVSSPSALPPAVQRGEGVIFDVWKLFKIFIYLICFCKQFFKDKEEKESPEVSILKSKKSFHVFVQAEFQSGIYHFHVPECLSVRADPASLWQRMV